MFEVIWMPITAYIHRFQGKPDIEKGWFKRWSAYHCSLLLVVMLWCIVQAKLIFVMKIISIVSGMRIGAAVQDETARNRITNSPNPLVYADLSKVQCGVECFTTDCFSMFYNTDTSTCVINTQFVDNSKGFIAESGWLFYEFKGNGNHIINASNKCINVSKRNL